MSSRNFKRYLFLLQYLIFYQEHNSAMALIGNIRPAEENEFPAIVSIMKVNNSTHPIETYHKCTGTLISKQDILTAEHCLRNTFTEGFKVMTGSRDLREAIAFFPAFVMTYEHWILYRRRNLELSDDDIALVKLIGNVPGHIEFAPLGNIENDLLYGMDVVTAGWGRLENNARTRILYTGKLRILTKDGCEGRIYAIQGVHININHNELCTAGNPPAVLNRGDSGGPIFFFGTLIGINRGAIPYESGPVELNLLNIHLGIRSYYEYIEDIIRSFHVNF